VALLALLPATSTADAHRLEADYRVLPERRVQVESWFDQGGVPRGAKVQVYRPDGGVLAEGVLNDEGLFVFSYSQVEPLKVVIAAGAGHRKAIYILQADLARGLQPDTALPVSPSEAEQPSAHLVPLVDRSSRIEVKDVLVGIGFVLALAAFVLSVRNARRLRLLESVNAGARAPTRNEPNA
jgi:nickel transport protein